jgi:putative ATP-dependent endonuclease of the OLD family
MRIKSIRIENFRVFKDVTVSLNPYTCFVGPNGSGKSTVINALNIFFREKSARGCDILSEEDFHQKNTNEPVRITVTFGELSKEAEEDFKHYCRQGQLVVTAEARWDSASQQAEVQQFGQRLGIAAFAPFFEALEDGEKVADLKERYKKLKEDHGELLGPGTKDKMAESLREYEAAHANDCALIPSEDKFYGVSKGANRLERHVQWVYVPAVKDAVEEEVESRNTALGKLLARTVRAKTNFDDDVKALRNETLERYQGILDKNQGALSDISDSLGKRLAEWSHPDATLTLQWQGDPQKSVSIGEPFAGILAGEAGFSGSLSRFGHGLQRSYLLAILHELAGCDEEDGPTLILACEEPELYQHPPQIRHLASVLQRLAAQQNQVMVCTHSPAFVSGECFEDVRMVRKNRGDGYSNVTHQSNEAISREITAARGEPYSGSETGTLAKINQALQPSLNEIFFTPILILVEGLEDVAYITTYLMLMGRWDDFRRHGCHIVPTNGKDQLIMPLAVARLLEIPVFTVFDADGDTERQDHRTRHEKDNLTLLKLVGKNAPAFPDDTLWEDSLVVWPTNIGDVVKREVDLAAYEKAKNEAHSHYGQTKGLGKNALLVARLLASLWDKGHQSESLKKLCESVLAFAESHGIQSLPELNSRKGAESGAAEAVK